VPHEDTLVVFAAASLRDAFTSMATDFGRAHDGVHVTFNFAGSQELRAQLAHGAAADVFASADVAQMEQLARDGRVASPIVFARNEPVLVVARDRAGDVRTFADLPRAKKIVLGADDVPIGRYSKQILDRASATLDSDFGARVSANVVSRELNVRQVLAKVALGEADAGIVYRTDVHAADTRVVVVDIPRALNVVADDPIAVVAGAAHPTLARAWVDFVRSEAGQRALAHEGFAAPASSASQ
jgi:molybdate transport system substrate-binding protein